MSQPPLSRRERQIMDVLYRRGRATAAEIQDELPDAPGYSGVRTILRVLVGKGHITHEREGARYVYRPAVAAAAARRSALRHVVRTFFGGSTEDALLTLLGSGRVELSDEAVARLRALVDASRSAAHAAGEPDRGDGA